MVAWDIGGYLRRDLTVSPVNGGKKFFCNAWRSVEFAGENKAAWANLTRFSGDALWLTACMALCGDGSSMYHSPLCSASRVPCRISFSCSVTCTSVAVKCASQPASHSWPIEMRDVSCRAGNMCAVRAALGRLSMGNSPSWVDSIVLWSGNWTCMGCFVLCIFWRGARMAKK